MSDDESFMFFVAGILAALAVWKIVVPLSFVRGLRPWWGNWGIGLAIVAAGVLLISVLANLSAKDVRTDGGYIALFMTIGVAGLGIVLTAMSVLGIGWRDDGLERRNGAAVVVAMGAIFGATLLYAGSNIGEGDTIWTGLVPGMAALAVWFVLWGMLQAASRIAEAVTVERDAASGVRLAALLVANGLLLGRAIAGDWVSVEETVHSFIVEAWPVVAFTVAAGILQSGLKPRLGERRRVFKKGVVPAGVMVVIAVVWVLSLGRW